jgi:3-oxoacyl-[acyl-carrier protein] reductase
MNDQISEGSSSSRAKTGGNLAGKVALVSGSGRGIGRAIAHKLASEGARVVVNDLDGAPGDAVAAEIVAAGGDAIAVNGDVTAPDFAERFVQTAIERFGGLDIIVNNAGYFWDSTIARTTDEQFQAMIDIHVKAPFRILRAASDPLRAFAKQESAEGRRVHRKVVNVTSVAGLSGNAGQAAYSSGKAAVVGLTKTMAKEWGRFNVNVNCVGFGVIETRLTQAIEAEQTTIDIAGNQIKVGAQPELIETWTSMIPLGRVGLPEEAAGAVYLFCTPESDYITGQVVICGGGLTL